MTRTIGSLFSGGGGWEAGAIEAGVRPLFGVEMDATVAGHYATVFGPHVFVGSVLDAPYRDMPRVDILVSSPPCQPTSKSGAQARARQRARGFLVDDEAEGSFCDPRVGLATLDAVVALHPRAVIVENSEAYIKSKVFREIRDALELMGYSVDAKILDASHYGVVSGRKRTILRATLGRLPPWPKEQPRMGWYSAVADLIPSLPPAKLAPWQSKAMLENPPPPGVPLLIAGGNPGRNDRGYIVHRAPWQVAWTTQKARNTTGLRVIDGDGIVRKANERVIARLQGFPDWYELPASRHLAINILGNSVPPVFAEALLMSVLP